MSERREWNHVPDELPIRVMPLWQWPPKPAEVLLWYWHSWFPLTVNLGIVALSFAALWWTSPTLEQAATPGGWIALIWLRNLVLVTALAQGLHLIFHHKQLQGSITNTTPAPFPGQAASSPSAISTGTMCSGRWPRA